MTADQPGRPKARSDRKGWAARLVAVATAAMPASRRDWGKALSVELAHATSRRDQARLVLAAVRIALLRPGLADYGRAASGAAALAAIAYIPLGLVLYLTNVIFAYPNASSASAYAVDGYSLVALMAAGALARRKSARRGTALIAGVTAGLVLAVLGLATFAVIDNVFLAIVSHQQGNIEGLPTASLTSVRAYIDADLKATAVRVAVVATVGGALFAPLGAALAPLVAVAWSRLRGGPELR